VQTSKVVSAPASGRGTRVSIHWRANSVSPAAESVITTSNGRSTDQTGSRKAADHVRMRHYDERWGWRLGISGDQPKLRRLGIR